LPRALASQLTLEMYLGIVHLLTIAAGLTAARFLLERPREDLGLLRPSGRAVGVVIGLLPAVFVLGTGGAFFIARPMLIAEILRGGTELAQKNTGTFGRELTQAPAALVILWGAVISPISEELFFHGVLWSLVAGLVARAAAPSVLDASPASLPVELMQTSVVARGLRALTAWLARGGVATLFVGALFGTMHHDMPGGLGIVRFVSALVLGLACGLARQYGGSVVPAIVLHVLWNLLSVAAVRRWIITETFPTRYGTPTLVVAIAVVTTIAVIAGLASGRRSAKVVALQPPS
jgi:membrane protease YdiL (CAAX protease family)